MSRYGNRHYVPAEKRKKDFPFSFSIEQLGDEEAKELIETKGIKPTELEFIPTRKGADIEWELRTHLIPIFEFHKYLDEESEDYIIKYPDKSPTYYVLVNIYTEQFEDQGLTATGKKRKPKVTKLLVNSFYVKVFDFKSIYSYTLIRSLEQLERVLEGSKVLTYDIESSGLDPEFDTIAGINFSNHPLKGYYIPIGHDKQFESLNLGTEAIDIFYRYMREADKTYMFNSRFDIRFLEFAEYDKDGLGNIINKKYDFKDINFVDAQISTYFSDPEHRDHSMAWAEKHFLGFHRPDLADTLKTYKLKTFDTTKIDPRNLLFYAAQDGITTYQLGEATEKYTQEFGLSGQIDMEIIYPLMDMENRLVKIDTKYLEETLIELRAELNKINEEVVESIGFGINLNSPKQKQELFNSFGLDTGVKTKTGAMSTGREAVDKLIERLDNQGKSYPKWLGLLGKQSQLQQLEGTFFSALEAQVGYRDGRLRLNYRHGVTSTGRFSSGKEE